MNPAFLNVKVLIAVKRYTIKHFMEIISYTILKNRPFREIFYQNNSFNFIIKVTKEKNQPK